MQEQKTNKGKKYRKLPFKNISSPNLCDRIRERLNLTKEQLSDADIKKVVHLSNQLIGEWILKNADGFQIKDNGRIAVSKWMPKCLRGDKEQKIEEIINNPKNDDYMKKILVARYQKGLDHYKKYEGSLKEGYYTHIHSFFYLYRVIWFNSRNCKFEKAEIYQLKVSKKLTRELCKKINDGQQYYEWNFSEFRIRRADLKRDKK